MTGVLRTANCGVVRRARLGLETTYLTSKLPALEVVVQDL
jgi:hypothetical protein